MSGLKGLVTGVGAATACLALLMGCSSDFDRGDTTAPIALDEEVAVQPNMRMALPGEGGTTVTENPDQYSPTTDGENSLPGTLSVGFDEEVQVQAGMRMALPGDDGTQVAGDPDQYSPTTDGENSLPGTLSIAHQPEARVEVGMRMKMPGFDDGRRVGGTPGQHNSTDPNRDLPGTLGLSALSANLVSGWQMIGPPPVHEATLAVAP